MERCRVKVKFPKDVEKARSRTKKAFAKNANINNVIARYNKTGVLATTPNMKSSRVPAYGDFSGAGDFLQCQIKVAKLQEEFDAMPSPIRAKFRNRPEVMIEYLSDPANDVEAIKLGLKVLPKGYQIKDDKLVLIDVAVTPPVEPTPPPSA